MLGTSQQARAQDEIVRSSAMQRWQGGATQVARWCAVALGFSVITSTALNGVLMGALLLAWLTSGGWEGKLHRIRDNEVAVAALALMLLAAAGALWSHGAQDDVLLFLNKYTKLLLIPILVTVVETADRRRGLIAMAAGLILSLSLSYGLAFGWLRPGWPLTGHADNPAALKNYISHNVFMAYGVLLFSVFAWQARSALARCAWACLASLAAVNLFMVAGRSGYVVLAAVVVVALFQIWRWRGLLAAAAMVAIGFAVAFTAAPVFKNRIALAVAEVRQYDLDADTTTSIGMRLGWYRNSVELIRERPLLGAGTGGFPKAYNDRFGQSDGIKTRNPHNQYVLTTAELGIVGLGALLLFFYYHARVGARLPEPESRILARGLLALMIVGCMFNSFLLDHNEGVFFCWLTGLLVAGAQTRPVGQSGAAGPC